MYTYICVYEWETIAFKHLWKRFKVFPFEKNQPRPDRVVQEPLEWRLCSSPLAASLRYPKRFTTLDVGMKPQMTGTGDWMFGLFPVVMIQWVDYCDQ